METPLGGPCSLLCLTATEPHEPHLWLLVPLLRGWVCFSVDNGFGYQHVGMLQFGLLDGQSQGLEEKKSRVRSQSTLNTGEAAETSKPLQRTARPPQVHGRGWSSGLLAPIQCPFLGGFSSGQGQQEVDIFSAHTRRHPQVTQRGRAGGLGSATGTHAPIRIPGLDRHLRPR